MPEPDHALQPSAASWSQLEHAIERVHAAARSDVDGREFYRRLLAEGASALGAWGGAAWRSRVDGRLELVCQSTAHGGHVEFEPPPPAERRASIQQTLAHGEAEILSVREASPVRREAGGYDSLVCPVSRPGAVGDGSRNESSWSAAIELWFPAGASPLVQQGWLDFAATLGEVAADFHALDELRRLRETAALHRQSVELLRRVHSPRDLTGAAFEVANEGRRALGCDRVSVLVRRSGSWRLLSASGVSRIERQTDFSRHAQRLAECVANWGEPISYPAAVGDENELPPTLAAAIEAHVDHSHARELACVPIAFAPEASQASPDPAEQRSGREAFDALLIAERFEAGGDAAWRQQLVELGELCGPALARAAALDRFPIRTVLRWSDQLGTLRQPRRRVRAVALLGGLAAMLMALIFVPATLTVEAPATLATTVERDVFATATGSVAEVRVEHGDMVAAGDVLLVLSDPELALKLQQVRGEIDATRKRLDALAVTRTDRALRENDSDDRLPLSAEQRQLEERLASLDAQATLLEARREALTLRSPLAGQVLTRDVQTLLASRPVERGQVLLTVADVASGWQLRAEVPQRQIGAVLEAQREQSKELPADYRLAGDVQQSYQGHVVGVDAATPLEAAGLEDEAPPVEVRIAIDGEPPAAARPGMSATVRIDCGKRSLGYVWLHDVWATVYRWMTF